jgi:hypothetical protein
VTGTPEELTVDFGLNKQVGGTAPETTQLTQRVIVNFFTDKRLAYPLGHAVARHEQAFETFEIDMPLVGKSWPRPILDRFAIILQDDLR